MELIFMNKVMKVITPIISVGCLATAAYMMMEKKKNMLDVIIEEIETMK